MSSSASVAAPPPSVMPPELVVFPFASIDQFMSPFGSRWSCSYFHRLSNSAWSPM
jgi:hypothetical protein